MKVIRAVSLLFVSLPLQLCIIFVIFLCQSLYDRVNAYFPLCSISSPTIDIDALIENIIKHRNGCIYVCAHARLYVAEKRQMIEIKVHVED